MVDGINIVTDFDLVKEMQAKMKNFTNWRKDFFPVNWPFSLNKNIVAPKPEGTRYLLYVDSYGDIYLENQTQNFFRVSQDREIQLLLPDTVLDGYFVHPIAAVSDDEAEEEAAAHPGENQGRLTFLIQDATRCNGVDLSGLGIVKRIAFIKVHYNSLNPIILF